MARLAAHRKLHGHLFQLGIGGHDGMGRRLGALISNGVHQLGNTRGKGPNFHFLADDTGRGHNDVRGQQAQSLGRQGTSLLSNLQAVGSAGVGVAAVADDGLGMAVDQMVFGHHNGGTLDLVLGVDARGRTHGIADNHRQIGFCLILPDAAPDAAGPESLGAQTPPITSFITGSSPSSYLR